MVRKDIGTHWDRNNRNAMNFNFAELYNSNFIAPEVVANASQAKSTAIQTKQELDRIVKEQTADGDLVPEITQARGDYNLLYERFETLDDYTASPQSPKPQKNGIQTCTSKLIHKVNEDRLDVVQKTNKGYVHYVFEKNNGASQEDRDYGVNHELLRIIGAYHIQDAYVYYDLGSPINGLVSTQYNAARYSTFETFLYGHLTQMDNNKTFASKEDGRGTACYKLEHGNEISYNIPASNHNKANILFLCTPGGSDSVQVKINDQVVMTFNPKTYVTNDSSNALALIEFDIPIMVSASSFKLSISNSASTGSAYPICANYFPLHKYEGQPISDYKCFGSSKIGWITSAGASDYALYDKTAQKWFGSYHGGEVSEYDRVYWDQGGKGFNSGYDNQYSTFESIAIGDWRIQREFDIFQQTSLANGQAKMVSKFDFNIDGSLEMDFGYYDGQVVLGTFYTALTCTETAFNYIFFPRFEFLGNTPAGGFVNLPTTEGKTSQVSSNDTLQLDLRFTRFNKSADARGVTVADNVAYRKVYYGPVYGSEGRLVNSLSFSKGIDFIVR